MEIFWNCPRGQKLGGGQKSSKFGPHSHWMTPYVSQGLGHSVQKLIVIFNKLLITFDCFLSLYDIHAYIKSLE